MSSFGTFQEWGQTRTGGPKLKIDGKWVFPQRQTNTDGLQPGMHVEYETHLGGDKGTLVLLDRIRPAPQTNGHSGHSAPAAAPTLLSPLDDSGMRFVSNLVGSAVAAGKVEKPYDLSSWTIGALKAFQALKSGEAGLDDDIPPEREDGSDDEDENPAPKNAGNW